MRLRPSWRFFACAIIAVLLECVAIHGWSVPSPGRHGTDEPIATFQELRCERLHVRLSSAVNVKDPVFAVLISLVESNSFGCLSGAQLAETIATRERRSRLPFQKLLELYRTPESSGASVIAKLDGPLDMRMPYRILWYRPARLRVDHTLRLREWSYPNMRVTFGRGSRTREHIEIKDVHIFALLTGSVTADIDAWLDRLLGGALDDMSVIGFAVFRHRGVWKGMGVGYNQAGSGRSGLFDFERDTIVYPMPKRMRVVARRIRRQIENRIRFECGAG
jgi:hypothetical protein